jgi:hypothetical protein
MATAGRPSAESDTACRMMHHARCAARTLDHLLLACVFSREVWFHVLCRCGWELHTPTADDLFAHWWLRVRKLIPKARRKSFNCLVLVVAWTIWLEPNADVFRSETASLARVVACVWDRCELWCRTKLVDRSQLVQM